MLDHENYTARSIAHFIEATGLKLKESSEKLKESAPLVGADSIWKCVLGRRGKHTQVTLFFSSPKKPELKHIVNQMVVDSVDLKRTQGGFEGWATLRGLDPDSRRAEHRYEALKSEHIRLWELLGSPYYGQLRVLQTLPA